MFTPADKPILSLFPGAGLLDRAFEEAGFVVFRGPEWFLGGDVRRFHPKAGYFWGVIGGPPCQDFSSARRVPPTGYGREMLDEFRRVVTAVSPEWWLCENVSRVPDVTIAGYVWQRFPIDESWFVDVSRLRHIQFGSRTGRMLHIDKPNRDQTGGSRRIEGAALASDSRPLAELLRLQGLPPDFDLPSFTREAAKKAVGNGVPLPMGRALVAAIVEAYTRSEVTVQRTLLGDAIPFHACGCGCGRRVTGKRRYYDARCRKDAQRSRDEAVGRERVWA